MAKLAQVVEGLTLQVKHLAMILDEVREDLVWAVRNDKFHAAGHSQQFVASALPTRDPLPPNEDDVEPLPEELAPARPMRPDSLFD